MASFFDNFSLGAIQEEEEALNNSFQFFGTQHGWPETVLKKMSVFATDDGVNISYDENLEEQVSSLEYGALGKPAQAAIRNFSAELDKMVANIIAKRGAEALFARGILP